MTVRDFLKRGKTDVRQVEIAHKLRVSRQAVSKMMKQDVERVAVVTLREYASAMGLDLRLAIS